MPPHAYPTAAHEAAVNAITDHFAACPETGAVVLVNSLARGKGVPGSDIDMVVLVDRAGDAIALRDGWERFRAGDRRVATFLAASPFAVVHVDIEEATVAPPDHAGDEYPDAFELVIGNWYAWAAPLWERDRFYTDRRSAWHPFYDEALRLRRLEQVRGLCVDCLDRIPHYVARGLHFHALSRLWRAFQLFLQALFLHRRTYPIAYDKWIREQVVDLLGLPELYGQLPGLFEISRLESDELVAKATRLRRLLDAYVPPAVAPASS